ncbi:MAG: AI-2E family transporter [Pseudonocardiales bacterium]|nr:AI-2E family transporter [Pseudonocardiales bacterium]
MIGVDQQPERRDPAAAVPYPLRVASAVSWRILVVAAALTVLGYVIINLTVVFIPLAVGLLLTALLGPVVNWLARHRVPRWLATVVVMVVGLAGFGGLLAFVVQAFVAGLPDLRAQVSETVAGLQSYLQDPPFGLPPVELVVEQARTALTRNRSTLTSGALATAYSVADFLTGIVLVIFVLIVFMYRGEASWQFLLKVVPQHTRSRVDLAGQRGYASLVGYVRATVLVAVIDAIGIGIGLVAVRAPLVVPLTALVFLSAFIPIVGAVLSGILAVLVVLVAKGPVAALIVLAVVLAVQQLEGNVLQPLIMGRAVALDALSVVLAVTVGTVLGGITGAVLAVPLLAMLNAAVRSLTRDDDTTDPRAVDQDDPRAAVPAGEPGSVEAVEDAKRPEPDRSSAQG